MPILGIGLSSAIALFFALHAIRTQQDRYWIYILFIVPILGSLIYFAVILLPKLRATPVGFKIKSKLRKTLDPERELREAQKQYELSQTTSTRIALGKALVLNNRADEALIYYQQALTDIYATSPDILLQYAYALFRDHQYTKAKETLNFLREKNPDHQSDEGHLLYTKILVSLNEREHAKEEFEALITYFPNLEAISFYLKTLIGWNQIDHAIQVLHIIEQRFNQLSKHSKRLNAKWIEEIQQSKQKLSQLGKEVN
ncbi:tetratricopeptide repeat protein [Gilliamella sp. B2776]|uniref:tetratricopeptide repeat protein n=1 Tax=unclassified Gilliamella TaxID=2685620 RepID=UPI00226AF379|nr:MULTISPECIES: tetratricopeptide repeat protein [unclassified Gilliamella]MCX8650804.1 tetratricopeptide repeat protein [Gilliamella sp. B2779]MCX8654217.1 tetratricopeptide repeat protein [Gilliamella sp. B2737]MCX8657128.1 tetratricopeptide repeat protein [Gilliamella sp. B2894]MCX8664877.1 tetratricopeptide repeat protein [Gilliamella sp. B2887]MCX8692652.1 tetratricopeptide repeat protein [Gilliamella sp. B2776]